MVGTKSGVVGLRPTNADKVARIVVLRVGRKLKSFILFSFLFKGEKLTLSPKIEYKRIIGLIKREANIRVVPELVQTGIECPWLVSWLTNSVASRSPFVGLRNRITHDCMCLLRLIKNFLLF